MWLFSKTIDLLVLYLPVWLCWVVLACLPESVVQADIPLWVWVIFVLGIDVGHVWSTLFRTYLDREEFANHRTLLLLAPVVSFLAVALLAWWSTFWFWRLLAYIALFHFVKQQYGFLALYKAKAGDFGVSKIFNDKAVLYMATLYPVLYWHLNEDVAFNWFVQEDFVSLRPWLPEMANAWTQIFSVTHVLYGLVLLAWLCEEGYCAKRWQWGKILWMGTTALNWYGGIVYFNSDLVFTVSNVVAHGVPYVALLVYYQHHKQQLRTLRAPSRWRWALLIVPTVLILAWVEEYCWDRWLFNERASFFGVVGDYSTALLQDSVYQAIAFGLLTLPQLTHYIIDGFIWRSNEQNPYVKAIFKGTTTPQNPTS